MSHEVPSGRDRNRLLLPLIGVSAVCVAEAVVIAFLLGRGGPAPSANGAFPAAAGPAAQTPSANAARAATPPESSTPAPAPANPTGPAITRGKLGQRVESAGLALTVLGVTNEPRYKEVTAPPPTQKFVGVEVVMENNTGAPHAYYSTSFRIKDDKDRAYGTGGLGVGDPPLEYGTIVTGEKVRGHLAFVVPKEATGLTLAYPPNVAPAGYRPIHIELGQ